MARSTLGRPRNLVLRKPATVLMAFVEGSDAGIGPAVGGAGGLYDSGCGRNGNTGTRESRIVWFRCSGPGSRSSAQADKMCAPNPVWAALRQRAKQRRRSTRRNQPCRLITFGGVRSSCTSLKCPYWRMAQRSACRRKSALGSPAWLRRRVRMRPAIARRVQLGEDCPQPPNAWRHSGKGSAAIVLLQTARPASPSRQGRAQA